MPAKVPPIRPVTPARSITSRRITPRPTRIGDIGWTSRRRSYRHHPAGTGRDRRADHDGVRRHQPSRARHRADQSPRRQPVADNHTPDPALILAAAADVTIDDLVRAIAIVHRGLSERSRVTVPRFTR